MAGDRDIDSSADEGAIPVEPPREARPKAKTFACPSCGASVTIRYPGASLSVTCDSCCSVIETSDENYRIISQYSQALKSKPLIELGTRGELFGRKWEVIGFLSRIDLASNYSWDEYLLFNPYYGYRWLARASGHWNFVTPIKEKPLGAQALGRVPATRLSFGDRQYKLFYKGFASVSFVLGEFYWRVRTKDRVEMFDYVCPPYMLSCEKDKSEIVWSKSEYVDASLVERAFHMQDRPGGPLGVAPNQPSYFGAQLPKVVGLWVVFAVILTFMEFLLLATSLNETAFKATYPFVGNAAPREITTPVFKFSKQSANCEIELYADVDNSWVYVAGELVNDKTGQTYPLEATVEHYHGYDGGEYWSEGSSSRTVMYSAVPAGDYYLNFDCQADSMAAAQAHHLDVAVKRDVGTFANYWWCMLFVSLFPLIAWWRSHTFEVARWSQSDFSPYQSSGDDSD